jgi:hypothetical protein
VSYLLFERLGLLCPLPDAARELHFEVLEKRLGIERDPGTGGRRSGLS